LVQSFCPLVTQTAGGFLTMGDLKTTFTTKRTITGKINAASVDLMSHSTPKQNN